MIYTLTLNPAIDYYACTERPPVRGEVHRLHGEQIRIGGKGINVSRMLAVLGVPSVAWGYIAGLTGEVVASGLREEGISHDFIRLSEGATRINVKLRDSDTVETELNGQGPSIPPDKWEVLLTRLTALGDGDTLILSGSLPRALPTDAYAQLLARVSGRGIITVVDTAGDALLATLPYHPFLIRPNREELSAIFSTAVCTAEEAVPYAERLQAMGARNVLVTLGGDGAVLLDERGRLHRTAAHRGKVYRTVGAGDATVAGFMAACHRTAEDGTVDYARALHWGVAVGGAVVLTEGAVTLEDVERMESPCDG